MDVIARLNARARARQTGAGDAAEGADSAREGAPAAPESSPVLARLNARAKKRAREETGGPGDAGGVCRERPASRVRFAVPGEKGAEQPAGGEPAPRGEQEAASRPGPPSRRPQAPRPPRGVVPPAPRPPAEEPRGLEGPEGPEGGASDEGDGPSASPPPRGSPSPGPPPPTGPPPAPPAPPGREKKERREAVLPWMRVPVAVDGAAGVPLGHVGGLDPAVATALRAGGVSCLFPIQAAVWQSLSGGRSARHDLAVCAPTGSGKTLAYLLPLVHHLGAGGTPGGVAAAGAAGFPRALRGLVVVPTRDLARQVASVLSPLAAAAGLALGVAAGHGALSAEAEALVGLGPLGAGPAGRVDALVATPGRLAAHLRATPGFSLADLSFLVVDEADRLLRQSYQEWLPKVGAASGAGGGEPGQGRRVVKVVASATLTRDPSKIARLGLTTPRYVAVTGGGQRYALPQGLREHKVVCPGAFKPHTLLALLARLTAAEDARVMVFASSVEASHRLALLLHAAHRAGQAPRAVEFSSRVSDGERRRGLALLREGRARVLVASDAATRGLDVEGVTAVVSYDPPVYAKTYVHRAGRTARAGRGGDAYTLLRPEEVWHFKEMLRKADNNHVADVRVPREEVDAYKPAVGEALRALAGGAGGGGAPGGVDAAVRAQLARAVDRARG